MEPWAPLSRRKIEKAKFITLKKITIVNKNNKNNDDRWD